MLPSVRFVCCLLLFAALATAARGQNLKQYDSPYYKVYTDVDVDEARESIIRMSRMAEEYHERTKGFSGVIRQKFPFYLFRNQEDYLLAGGMPGTGGLFIYAGAEGKLMAVAGDKLTVATWHTVQHEGFHQFAHAVIGGDLPPWLNEGLAEYFGEAVFTGDSFVTGVIPAYRIGRIQAGIKEGKFKTIPTIMSLSHDRWNREMQIENYDQAWSMVHFLVHGDGGKYQQAFSQFIVQIGREKAWDRAWMDTLGPAGQCEQRWKEYWLNLPEHPTLGLYSRATGSILTSYLARATAQKQTFADFAAFHAAATARQLKISDADWLPPSLLDEGFGLADRLGEWTLQSPGNGKPPTLTGNLPSGIRVNGSFTMKSGKVDRVIVEVDDLAKTVSDAKKLMDAGLKDRAKAMLQEGIKTLPKSAAIGEAKEMLQAMK